MNPSRTILIPLPLRDFDPTEAAVSWQILRAAGHRLVFATVDGSVAQGDPLMLSGEGLDPWGWMPGLRKLRVFGLMLRADRHGRAAYAAMVQDPAFQQPQSFAALDPARFDALLLPGGHAKGMRPYLEDARLQAVVADFFDQDKPVAAVCHGVLLAARSQSPRTGKSVLHGRKTTALTWKLEKSASDLSRFLVRFWDPGYYRTYEETKGDTPGYWSVEQEVKRALAAPEDFVDVAPHAPDQFRKTSGLLRDTLNDERPAWVVRDGRYLSARWPGDVHTFARRFAAMLSE